MTDPYEYTDRWGAPLVIGAMPDEQVITIETPADPAQVLVTELHDVIAGMLAQAAAAQGRTWTSALAQARADVATIHSTPAGLGDDDLAEHTAAWAPANDRLHDEHLPLLLALAEAYTGHDSPLWQEYARVQTQRDIAKIISTEALKTIERRTQERDQAARDRDEARAEVRGVQGWMALDLHTALGLPVDHSADCQHQGRRSWGDWWAELCAAVRNHPARVEAKVLRTRVTALEAPAMQASARTMQLAAEHLRTSLHPDVYHDMGQRAGNGVLRAADELDELARAVTTERPAAPGEPLAASTAPLAAGHPRVQGRCPACGSRSLFLGAEGYVTCAQQDCLEPDAATTVLERASVLVRETDPHTTPCPGCGHPQCRHAISGWCHDCVDDCTHAAANPVRMPAARTTDTGTYDNPDDTTTT